ncbi:hypothetical protein ACFLTL_00285 [Chloroflexota bacterium]
MAQLKKHKRILPVVVPVVTCLILLFIFGAMPVGAAVSVTVSPDAVAYGIIDLGTSASSGELTVTNNGDEPENFSIMSTDAIGSTHNWTLEATPGNNQFTLEFSTDSGDNWEYLTTSYQALVNDVAVDGSVTLLLRITMPSSTSDYQEHNITVTILAEASGS